MPSPAGRAALSGGAVLGGRIERTARHGCMPRVVQLWARLHASVAPAGALCCMQVLHAARGAHGVRRRQAARRTSVTRPRALRRARTGNVYVEAVERGRVGRVQHLAPLTAFTVSLRASHPSRRSAHSGGAAQSFVGTACQDGRCTGVRVGPRVRDQRAVLQP